MMCVVDQYWSGQDLKFVVDTEEIRILTWAKVNIGRATGEKKWDEQRSTEHFGVKSRVMDEFYGIVH